MSPFHVSMIIVSAVFLIAGIVWPQAAETLLRMMLAILAVGFVVARAYRAGLPSRTMQESYSPFDGLDTAEGSAASPRAIRELTEELGAADEPEVARRTAIPWRVGRIVREEASRRLAEDHGLRLDDPDHHPRIRSLVSEATWFFIRPLDQEILDSHPGPRGTPSRRRSHRSHPTQPSHATAGRRTVPLSRLDLILDDLERL